MNRTWKTLLLAAVICAGTVTFAGPHHHKHNEGLRIANGIVDMVLRVTNPQAIQRNHYYRRPAPPPPPKRYRRPAPRRNDRYDNRGRQPDRGRRPGRR